jgi:hypothetical protein
MESGQNKDPPQPAREDMDCEESVPIKEDNNIYVSRFIPTQSLVENFQPRSEIVGPSLRSQYHKDGKNQAIKVEEEDAEKSKPYETVQVLIRKKPKNKGQIKSEKQNEEDVLDPYNDDHLGSEESKVLDLTNAEAKEDYQGDEDDDGKKFALAIGAVREEELTQTEDMQEDDFDQENNTKTIDCNMVYVFPRDSRGNSSIFKYRE